MENMETLKHMLCRDMDEIARSGKLSGGSLEMLASATTALKNLYKIEMLEEESEGYSGKHYVRGHYSREGDNYARDGYSRESSYRGYSRDEAKDYIVHEVEEMMDRVHDPRDRETLKRVMQQMK